MTALNPQAPLPLTLQEAFAYFADKQRCIDFMVKLRWPDGKVTCPTCGSDRVTWLPKRFFFQCKTRHSKNQFSVKVGTVMEESLIPLDKWLVVAWMLGNCRNGISSYEVARTIGICQKSAWFMLHRLRCGMASPTRPLDGDVEMDETYIGGSDKNKHTKDRKGGSGRSLGAKTPVFGMIERGGRVIARAVPDARESTILPIVKSSVHADAMIYTDSYTAYDKLRSRGFNHLQINHTRDSYVVGPVHTNTIENFWSGLKRTLGGTYVSVRPKHLEAYVQESAFRFNVRRGFTEHERFSALVAGTHGRRLTYKKLVE